MKKMHEIYITLMIQKIVHADNEEDYIDQRDQMIHELEGLGFSVNIEDEFF